MPAQYPTDFHDRAVYYRKLAVHEEDDTRANALFQIASLFERMALDFAEYFPRHTQPTAH